MLCASCIAGELLFVHGIFGKERNRKSGLKFMDTKRFLLIIKMGGSQCGLGRENKRIIQRTEIEVSKITVFYVIEMKDEMCVYSLKNR